jgi:hypothetical protein
MVASPFRVGELDYSMRRPSNLCLVLAGMSLVGGVLTLEVGQAREVAIGQLFLAIMYAVLSLRVRRDD